MTSSSGPDRFDAEQLERFHRLYALRAHVEGFAAREAARQVAQGKSVEPLAACYRRMGDAAQRNDYESFRDADMAFHRCIAEIADVPALVAIWDVVEAEMRAFVGWAHRWVIKDLVAIAGSHEWHFTAIRDGQPRSAERAAEVGLDSLWQILAEQPAETLRETDPLERVCAYVLLNLHMPLSLQAVARDVAFLSPSHLAKQFRDVRKESFTAYVQGLRQRRAAHLLATTDLSIQAIIDRVGAPDLSRFAGQFRRAYGCTPSGYKRRLREGK